MTKPLAALLAASLALNAAFAVVLVLGTASTPPASRETAPPRFSPRPAPLALSPNLWPDLKSDDLSALADRLRAAGFPREIVRALVATQIAELFAARRKALEPTATDARFWKAATPDPQTAVAQRQLDREERNILRTVLGADTDQIEEIYLTQQGGRVDFLPKDKADEVLGIAREFYDRRLELWASGTYEADREKSAALDRAQHDAIAHILSPEQLFEFDLRNGDAARNLRSNLAAFDPTEVEFRAIYQLRRAYDERYSGTASFIALSPEQTRERDAAKQQLTEQIKATLPPERAAAYDRANDYYYQQSALFVARLELPAATTLALWNAKQEFEKRRDEISRTTPAADRAPLLNALHQEAVDRLTPLLGAASRIENYKQYGGYWLTTLATRPAPK